MAVATVNIALAATKYIVTSCTDQCRCQPQTGIGSWFSLVDRLSGACESEIEALIAQGVPTQRWPRIAQIKEKMGGLRFYVNGPLSNELRAQILQAENIESLRACERCGAPGRLREGRWRHTYCDNCEMESEANIPGHQENHKLLREPRWVDKVKQFGPTTLS